MPTRRSALLGMAALAACGPRVATPKRKRVAVTMDDFDLPEDYAHAMERDLRIRSHLPAQAAGFVSGRYETRSAFDDVLAGWAADGHILANHSYSHGHSGQGETDAVWRDILRNDRLLRGRPGFQRYFRFPYLDEGRDRAQQLDYHARLAEAGYTPAPVTIDTFDWNVTGRLERERAEPQRIRDYWIESVLMAAAHEQAVAEAVGEPDLPHQMLVHHNALNALFLGDLLDAMRADGWTVIPAQEALDYPLYAQTPPDGFPGGLRTHRLQQAMGLETPRVPDALRNFGTDRMDALGL